MESVPFSKIENIVNDLLDKVDRLTSENKVLRDEIEDIKGNHQAEKRNEENLRKEKDDPLNRLQYSQPDQKREEKIRNHIDYILKKLKELQSVLE